MFGTLSRPLPKKQVSRLLWVDAAVILVLLGFPVRSAWTDYHHAKMALEAQETVADGWELDVLTARRAERDRPIRIGEIRAAVDQLSQSSQSLRSPGEVAAILEEVRDLARRMGLENISITPGALSPQAGFQYHEMIVAVSGTFSELLRFLHALQNQTSLYIYSSLELRVEAADARRPQLRMVIGLRTVLVDDLIPLSEVTRLAAENAIGIPPDSTAAGSGESGDGGESSGEDGDR